MTFNVFILHPVRSSESNSILLDKSIMVASPERHCKLFRLESAVKSKIAPL